MSKKPKSRHRIPAQALTLRSDPLDERYAAEVERSSTRLVKRYQVAQAALWEAEIDLATTPTEARRHHRVLDKVTKLREEVGSLQALLSPETDCGNRRIGVPNL